MKNKLGKITMTVACVSMALFAMSCSSNDSSVTGGDTEEYSEVVESSSDEEVEVSSSSEKKEKVEKPSEKETPSSDSKEEASSDSKEKNKQAESSSSEKNKEKSSDSKEEKTEPVETSSSSEESLNTEEVESSSSEEAELLGPEPPTPSCFENPNWNEAGMIEDTVKGYVDFESSLEDLKRYRYEVVNRWDEEISAGEYLMDQDVFYNEYRTDYDLRKKLVDCGVVWTGGEWNSNRYQEEIGGDLHVHCASRLDTLLVAYRGNNNIGVHAAYRTHCSIGDAPNVVETEFYVDVPVRYNVDGKPYNSDKKEED
jgi:hypothetical protein